MRIANDIFNGAFLDCRYSCRLELIPLRIDKVNLLVPGITNAMTLIRLCDVSLSILALAALSPLLLLVALIIYFTGDGEIIFRQERAGQNGQIFRIYKFATMAKNSAKIGSGLFTEKNDARILPFGGWLRQTRINELPQIFNVVKGDMSVVGFRPFVNSTYLKAEKLSKKGAYTMKPGMTSIASILGINYETLLLGIENREDYYFSKILPEKVKIEDWWAENISVKYYILVIIFTVIAVIYPRWKVPVGVFRGLESALGEVE